MEEVKAQNLCPPKKGKIQILAIVFTAVFALVFGIVLLLVLPEVFSKGWLIWVMLLLCILGITCLWFATRKLSMRQCRWVFYLGLVVFAGFAFWFGWNMRVTPAWDFGWVFAGGRELAVHDGFSPAVANYFATWPNNFFLAMVLSFWFGFWDVFSVPPMVAGIALNVLAVVVAHAFIFEAVADAIDAKFAAFAVLPSLLAPAVLWYMPIVYSDTLSMPFVCFIVFGAVKAYKAKTNTQIAIWAAILGFVTVLGYLVKGSVPIVTVAVLITGLLFYRKKALLFSGVLLAAAIALFVVWKMWMARNPYLSPDLLWQYETGFSHYIMMGLRGNGGYNLQDYEFSALFANAGARETANWQVIGQRIKDFGFLGLFKHLATKLVYTWGDGTYFSVHKLIIDPAANSALQNYVMNGGTLFVWSVVCAHAAQLLLLFSIAAGAVLDLFRRKANFNIWFCIRLAVFGLLVFLLIWETRSRYLVNFFPLLMILQMYFADAVLKKATDSNSLLRKWAGNRQMDGGKK